MCATHRAQQRAHSDNKRGTARQRGYDEDHAEKFRAVVLNRDDWTCVLCGADATDADHYPQTRRELLAAGLNPNDPRYGRSLCHQCHSAHTARSSGTSRNLRH